MYIIFCIARCKSLPERPKNGIVIAPKTDHGMKALYRCRDGFQLEGPNVTECHFGKWTVITPKCVEGMDLFETDLETVFERKSICIHVVYCPFPGFIENGKVLLVGHMGMYDYRPYVKKVTNNKQILFECDRGYHLDNGPPGATCVDGQWSPQVLPRCVRGSHPKMRWLRSVGNSLRRRKWLMPESTDLKSHWKKSRGRRHQKLKGFIRLSMISWIDL